MEAKRPPVLGESETVRRDAPVYSRTFWIVFSAQFAVNLAMNAFVMFPVELARMGASAALIGVVTGIGWMAALAARPACGIGIDRYGRRSIALVFLLSMRSRPWLTFRSMRWAFRCTRCARCTAPSMELRGSRCRHGV